MFTEEYYRHAHTLLAHYRSSKYKIATAESCTGGLLAALLTEIPGSSSVLERGFVTYSNEAKVEMLDVPLPLIAAHGAVSREVALAMAKGAIAHSHADIAVSITGIAGPDGGSAEKPVGLVWFGIGHKNGKASASSEIFSGNRQEIRLHAVMKALKLVGLDIL